MTDAVTDTTPSSNNNDNSPATQYDLSDKTSHTKNKSYTLKDYMPIVGMIYPTVKSKSNLLGKKRKYDAEVLRALWSQKDTGDNNEVQALIAPIFTYAAWKIDVEGLNRPAGQDEVFQGGHSPEENYMYEDVREDDIKRMRDAFVNELWDISSITSWVRKVSRRRFAHFFKVLADARLYESCFPKNDGAEQPELVRQITKFLDTASRAGTCWMMKDEDEDEDSD